MCVYENILNIEKVLKQWVFHVVHPEQGKNSHERLHVRNSQCWDVWYSHKSTNLVFRNTLGI